MMKPKTRVIIIAATAFVAGSIIGGLATTALMRHRFKEIRFAPPSEAFIPEVKRITKPNAQQEDAVNNIVTNRSRQVDTLWTYYREGTWRIVDSLQTDLAPVLTEDQRQRLQSHFNKVKDRELHRKSK